MGYIRLLVLVLAFAAETACAGMAEADSAYNKQDYLNALNFYSLESNINNNPDAQYKMGFMYENGMGVPKDNYQAAYWYRKAIERGNSDAQTRLSAMLPSGQGLPKGGQQAVNLLRNAAESGNWSAQVKLGTMYANDQGVTVTDDHQAMYWYRKAANQSSAKVLDQEPVASKISQVAEGGNAQDAYRLANQYDDPRFGMLDLQQAAYWFRIAADRGDTRAWLRLGIIYDKGIGVPEDAQQAAYWYLKSANQRNAVAQNNLGAMYRNGRGVPQDDRRAKYWYLRSADQGNTVAQSSIGEMYARGFGVTVTDLQQGLYWYRKAEDQRKATGEIDNNSTIADSSGVLENDQRLTYQPPKAVNRENSSPDDYPKIRYPTENGASSQTFQIPQSIRSESQGQPTGYKSSPARQDGTLWNLRKIAESSIGATYLTRPDQSVYETIKVLDVRVVVGVADRIGSAANINPVLLIRESEELNAWASFDKTGKPVIVLNKKMWDLIKNDSDMAAALIGHEMAHLYFRHPGATAATDIIGSILGALAGVALENAAQKKLGVADVGMQAGVLVGTAFSTSFTRDQEREADRQGIIWAKKNGYDPMGAIRLFQVLEAQGGNSLIPFFQTHPNPSERIDNAREGLNK